MQAEFFVFIALIALAGSLAGLLAGLFGLGGGIVIVPVLYALFLIFELEPGAAMAMAVASSLVTILPTSISSIVSHHRLQNIDWVFIRTYAWVLVPGAIAGAILVSTWHGEWLALVFGLLLMFVAILVLRKGRRSTDRAVTELSALNKLKMLVSLLVLAFISALAGVGGGALGSPLLLSAGYSIHRAIGTAACFGLFISLPSVLLIASLSQSPVNAPPWSWGLISLPAVVLVASFSVLAAPLGARVGKRLSPKKLSSLLAILLFILAAKMIFSAI